MNRRFKNSDFENAGLIKPNSRTQVMPGTILVASPALQNTPFERAVVLVLQNPENGIFGVVLNKPGTPQLRSAWLQMTGASDGEHLGSTIESCLALPDEPITKLSVEHK